MNIRNYALIFQPKIISEKVKQTNLQQVVTQVNKLHSSGYLNLAANHDLATLVSSR